MNYWCIDAKKTFVVFGAHSRKPSFVAFKSFKGHSSPLVHQKGKQGRGQPGGSGRSLGNKRATRNTKKGGSVQTKKQHRTPSKKGIKSTKKIVKNKQQKKSKITAGAIGKQGSKIKIGTKQNLKKQHIKKQTTKAKRKEKKKKPQPQQPEIKKEQPKPQEPEPHIEAEVKKEETKQNEPPHNTEQPIENNYLEDTATDTTVINDAPDDETGFNLIGNYDKKDLVMYQKHVQREVDRLWRPPVGVPKGTVSTVLFTIKSDGTVTKYELIKRSNVLIYDLSIMRVALNFQFDKCLWGKQFKIDFRQ